MKEVHDREDSVSHSKLHTEAAGKREGNLHLLSHTHHQLPAAGRRTLLQHILPQASVQRNKVPRVGNKEPCKLHVELYVLLLCDVLLINFVMNLLVVIFYCLM